MKKQQKGGVFSQLVLVTALILAQSDAGALNKNKEIQKVKTPKPLLQSKIKKNKKHYGVNTMNVLSVKAEATLSHGERLKAKKKSFRATSIPRPTTATTPPHRSGGSRAPDNRRSGTVFSKEEQMGLNDMKALRRFERLRSSDRAGMLKRNDHSLHDNTQSGGIERIESGHPLASGGIERIETGAPSASGGIERVETGAPSASGGIERVGTGAPSASGGIERVESGTPSAIGSIERVESGSSSMPGGIERVGSTERNSYGIPGGGDYRGGTRVNHGIHGNPDTATLSNGEEVLLNENIEVKGDGSLHDNTTGRNVRVDPKTGETVVTNPGDSEISRTPAPNGNSGDEPQDGNNSKDSGSNQTESDNKSDVDSNDSDDSGTGNNDNDSGETDDGGTETGEGETETEGGAAEYGEGSTAYNRAPGAKVIDDFVAKKTGEKNDVESVTPEPCGDDDGSGPVSEPTPGEVSNCLPGAIQGEEEEEQAQPPTVEEHLASRTARSTDNPREQVVNPSGLDDERLEDYNPAMETLEAIGHGINPGNR